MNNVVMLIRYYCFLALLHLVLGDCNRSVYKIPLVDHECLGQRSIVVNNVYGCRGNCESVSQPKLVTTESGVATIKPVTHCKCCTALEVERKTFTVRCRRKLGYKTFEVMSAVICACRSCGPDTYEYSSRNNNRDNKRKRNRSIGSFDDWANSEDELDAGLFEEQPTDEEGSAGHHSSQSTNFRDSDRLR